MDAVGGCNVPPGVVLRPPGEREFFIDNLLVRIHFIIVMFRRTGIAPWQFEFPFPGSLTSTFLRPPGISGGYVTSMPSLRDCLSQTPRFAFPKPRGVFVREAPRSGPPF